MSRRRSPFVPTAAAAALAALVLLATFALAGRDRSRPPSALTRVPFVYVEEPVAFLAPSATAVIPELAGRLAPPMFEVEQDAAASPEERMVEEPAEDPEAAVDDGHGEASLADLIPAEPAPAEEPAPEPAPDPAPQPAKSKEPASAAGLSWPLIAPLTSLFGPAHPLGIDFAANQGTPVRAAGDGRVRAAAYNEVYGHFVILDHPGAYTTVYAHFAAPASVRTGQGVSRGEVLGLVGSTGKSTGPHLHFEVHLANRLVDPLAALPRIPLTISPLAYRLPATATPQPTAPPSTPAPVATVAAPPPPTVAIPATPAPVAASQPPPSPRDSLTPEPAATVAVTLPPMPSVMAATAQPVVTVVATVVATATRPPSPVPAPTVGVTPAPTVTQPPPPPATAAPTPRPPATPLPTPAPTPTLPAGGGLDP